MIRGSLRRRAPGLGPALLRLAAFALLAGGWLAGCAGSTPAPAPTSTSAPSESLDGPVEAAGFFGFDLLGEAVLSTQAVFDGTLVGGLSSLAWDPEEEVYYAISDDPASRSPARFYTLEIDLGDGTLDSSRVEVVGVTALRDQNGAPFAEMTLDPEGLTLTPERTLLISSEGQVSQGVDPFVHEFRLDGSFVRRLEIPRKFLPRGDGSRGIRHNLGFETVTLEPETGIVYTATENALVQDGPEADVGVSSPARILGFDPETVRSTTEYVYLVEPVALAPVSADDFRTRGLVDLVALGDGRFLALERSYTQGVGNQVEIFLASVEQATDVSGWEDLSGRRFRPAAKTLLLSLAVVGLELDNLEGLAFGPRLPDGRRTLLLVSDNNFNPGQRTQILAFALEESPPGPAHIQGVGHRSPFEGAWVRGVRGTVTASAERGTAFWIQASSDGNDDTSDALRVSPAEPATPDLGDVVVVEGLVAEPGFPDALTVTTLDQARFEVVGREQPLPAPVRVRRAGAPDLKLPAVSAQDLRTLPARVDDDRLTSFEPREDAIDFFESLEGMRVEIGGSGGLGVVGPTSRFGEIAVLGEAPLQPGVIRSRAGGLVVTAEVESPPLFLIAPQPQSEAPRVVVGDRFEEPITGVVDYAFGTFRILAEPMPSPVPGSRAEISPTGALESETLRLATYNVENLSAVDEPSKFARLAESIAEALGAPDILAVQEIQDDSGPEDDGTVTAEQTLSRLIAAIRAAGGPSYEGVVLDPEDGADGGRPGANIRVAYLYRPDRVRFVARGVPRVQPEAEWLVDERGPFLSPNPGRLDPGHPAFAADSARNQTGSRKPLAAEFEFGGRRLFLVNVHLRSKRGDSPRYGALQPPERRTEPLRGAEISVIVDFLGRLFELDPSAAAIVLGDFNEHPYRPPMRLFQDAGFADLAETVLETDRYTYIFRGVSQVLDNVLLGPGLARRARARARVVHTNSDLPHGDRASDHDPILVSLEFATDGPPAR